MSFETTFTVEWGDCDEAGIVYYPNYFYWIDCTFQRWMRANGISHRDLRSRFRIDVPLMDVGCNFRKPVRYDDVLTIRSRIAEWKEKRFRVEYEMFVDGLAIGTGHELRGWVHFAEDGSLKSRPIDPEFKAKLGG
ncbi:MAG: acyl-CoA thioesterase [Hyphomicrobiaceae bacterium]